MDHREHQRLFLAQLRQQALAAGAQSMDVHQRYGELGDTLAEQEAGVRLLVGLPLHVLMSGPDDKEARKQLDWAQTRLASAGFTVQAELTPGDPERVIAQTVLDRGMGLLVMGSYSHSPLRSWLLGSKTSDLLRSARVPTLLLR